MTDIDNILIGDHEGLKVLIERLEGRDSHIGFAIVTGRSRESAVEKLEDLSVPLPNILITCVGTETYYGPRLVPDFQQDQYFPIGTLRTLSLFNRRCLKEIPGGLRFAFPDKKAVSTA